MEDRVYIIGDESSVGSWIPQEHYVRFRQVRGGVLRLEQGNPNNQVDVGHTHDEIPLEQEEALFKFLKSRASARVTVRLRAGIEKYKATKGVSREEDG